MAPDDKNIQALYNAMVNDGYTNLGTIDEFRERLKDSNNVSSLYDALINDGYTNLGTFDEFKVRVTPSYRAAEANLAAGVDEASNRARQAQQQRNMGTPGYVPNRFGIPTQQGMGPVADAAPNPQVPAQPLSFQERVQKSVGMAHNVGKAKADFSQRMSAIEQGNKPFSSGKAQQYDPTTGETKDVYYTTTGQAVSTPMERDIANIDNSPQGRIGKELEDAYAERDRLEQELSSRSDEVKADGTSIVAKIGAGTLLGLTPAGVLAPELAKRIDKRIDPQWAMLNAAKRANDKRIAILERDRDRDGFFRTVGKTLFDIDTWDFGANEIADAVTLSAAADKKLTGKAGEAQEALMRNTYLKQIAEQRSEDDTFMQRAGDITANAIPFVLEFILTGGGYAAIGAAGRRLGAKAAAKIGAKGFAAWTMKNTGTLAGNMLSGLLMANTTGLGRTAADIMGRHQGVLTQDENGEYVFRDGKSWGRSVYEGEMAQAIEYFTEHLGNSVFDKALGKWVYPTAGKLLTKGLDKLGASKVSEMFSRMSNSQWAAILDKGGIQGYPSEVLEEGASIVLNSLLVGDNQFSDLWDRKTLADILGGMALSIGFMQAPGVAHGAYNTAQYYRFKHSTEKSDQAAANVMGEQWEGMRDLIDNTPNEGMQDVIEHILDSELPDDYKSTSVTYAYNLMKLRGYNLRTAANAKDRMADTDENGEPRAMSEEEAAVNEAYANGYEADEQQRSDISIEREDNPNDPQAQAAWQGVEDRIRQDAADRADQRKAEGERMAYKGKGDMQGMLRPLTIKEESSEIDPQTGEKKNKVVYLVNGTIAIEPNGNGLSREGTDKTIYVYDPETGDTHDLDPFGGAGVLSVGDVVSIEDYLANNEQQSQAEVQQEIDNATGKVNVAPNTPFVTPEGRQGIVKSVEGENVIVQFADGEMEEASIPLADMQQYADALRRQEYEARHPQQTPAEQPQQPNTATEGQAPTATAETPTEGENAAEDTRTPAQRTYDDMTAKYGEKASHKVDVTLKDRKATLDSKKKALDKAQAEYDDAPIGKEDKAEAALAKAQAEYDAALADYNAWDEVRKLRDQALLAQGEAEDAARKAELERKRAEETEAQRKQREAYEAEQARRKAEAEAAEKRRQEENERLRQQAANPQPAEQPAPIEETKGQASQLAIARQELEGDPEALAMLDETEPRTLVEVAATLLASGKNATKLLKEDFKRETGYSDADVKRYPFLFAGADKGGITLARFGEMVVEAAREYGVQFDENDATAGIGAALELLGSVGSQADINDYITNSRIAEAYDYHNAALAAARARMLEAYGMTESEYEAYMSWLEDAIEQGKSTLSDEEFNQLFNVYEQGQETDAARGNQEGTETTERTESVETEADKNSERGNSETDAGAEQSQQPAVSTAQAIAAAEAETDTNPTEGQKEAGNYKKGHVRIDGYDITIEQPKGSVRRGTDKNGRAWEQEMHNTYGYIRGTESVDGDHIDIFLSDDPTQGNVYVVDQVDPETGEFDEHKVMYGFPDMESARQAYLSNYEDGWRGLGTITPVSKEEFKKWIESSHRKTKPFSEYKGVKTDGDVMIGEGIKPAAGQSEQETNEPKEPKRLISDEQMDELKERLRKKLRGQLNSGIDPETLSIGLQLAVGHIERGLTKFADFAKRMIEDLGDAIRPYLKSFYNGARDFPGAEKLAEQMTPYDEVRAFDVENFDKARPSSIVETAKEIAAEQEIEKQVEKIKKPSKGNKKEDSTLSNTEQGQLDLFGSPSDTETETPSESNLKFTEEQRAKVSEWVKGDLLRGLDSGERPFKSVADIRKMAQRAGLDVDMDGRDDVALQEMVEDGLVRAARQIIERGGYGGSKSRTAYEAVCKLYDLQPTISRRSDNRVKMQQYSTPLPMAFVADMFAWKPNSRTLEPTAGNGMLVFAIPAKDVVVNELDETRLANLRQQGFEIVLNEDATSAAFTPKAYDSVIANPPFGKAEAKEYDGKSIAGLDEQIALNALSAMKDNGKAAIIIGGNMEYGSNGAIKGNKAFWTYLYDHYNVKGVVDMAGKLYAKQGTTYPTRMILIDGRRSEEERAQSTIYPPRKHEAIRKAETFDDLYDIVTEVLNSNKKTNGNEVLRTSSSPVTADTDIAAGKPNAVSNGEQPNANADNGQNAGTRPTDSRGSGESNKPIEQRPTQTTARPSNGGTELTGNAGVSKPQGNNGGNAVRGGERGGSGRAGDTERVQHDGVRGNGNAASGVRLTEQRETEKRTLTEEKLSYRPHNSAFSLQSVAPAAMVKAMDKSLAEIENTWGNIDEFVTNELGYDSVEEMHNALAAEQVDSVAMAIFQMQQGKAMIIGDQTGVGKGRQMAALIRWACRHGKKPIFITQKDDLFTDLYRDLVDVGSGDLRPFIFNAATESKDKETGKKKYLGGVMLDADGNLVYKALGSAAQAKIFASGKLPDEYDFVVLTYSQVNTGDAISSEAGKGYAKESGNRSKKTNAEKNNKPTPKATFLRSIAQSNYLFLDESHTAAGDSNVGAYIRSIIGTYAGSQVGYAQGVNTGGVAGVTFASATFAKRPDTMPMYAMRTAMSEANVQPYELISIIARGGVTLQEIMSRALTESGQMVRRERDMSDVRTDWETIDNPELVQRARENYDKTIVAFNAIIKFQEDYVKPMIDALDAQLSLTASSADVKKGTNKMGVENVPFASKTYNYTKQLMLALKVDAIVDRVEQEIKAGRHPVIALESTMEASIKDYNAGDVIGEPTFSASLLRGLDNCMQYTVKDEDGKESHFRYDPRDLGPDGERAYYELQDFIRQSTSGVFISPLDAIIEKLHERGYKVGELTGRNSYVERDADGNVVVKKRTDKDKKRMQRDFNSGALDVLILNKSASTGISLHASEKFSDQRQRSMIIAQPLSDINDYMQMIGRIDRTGQVHRGYYINLGLPVPAESRFLMMLSTKLKSLNANTTTSQESESSNVEAPDLLNKYGSQVIVEYLRDNPDIYVKMGEPLKKSMGQSLKASELDTYEAPKNDEVARKITGYVALLNTKEQEDFYNDVVRRYTDLIKYLDSTGTNDLKITVMPLKAKTLSKSVSSEGKDPNGNNPFAQNAYVEEVEMDVLRKPMKSDEIRKSIEQLNNLQGTEKGHFRSASEEKTAGERALEIAGIVEREEAAKLAAEEERHAAALQSAETAIAKRREKLSGQQNISEEEKSQKLAEYTAETMQRVNERHEANMNKIRSTTYFMKEGLRRYSVGKTYILPQESGSEENTASMFTSPAIFCGYKVKDSKLTPSTSFAVFATLDGRRRIEVKFTDNQTNSQIGFLTSSNYAQTQQVTLDNWDSHVPTNTRKKGYIMTGNILQAVSDTQDEATGAYVGQLISYTDEEGNIHDGVLMPDRWQPAMLKTSGVPILARLGQLLRGGSVTSTDGKVSITTNRYGDGELSVPKTKKEGEKYFTNETILSAISGGFWEKRGKFNADIEGEDNIRTIVTELSNMGVRVKADTEADSEVRFRTSTELFEQYPTWLSGQTTATGQHTTQITSTAKTYQRIGDWMQSQGMEGAKVLDASSGLGAGTQALRDMGFDVEDVEPYPSENREAPTYTRYEDVNGKYDVVISNAVLNVIPDDWRADVLRSMADKVKEGGKLIINVRDAKSIESQKQKIELDSPSEILVTDSKGNIRAYQKGFTKSELKAYVESELGEGWQVEIANEGNSGVKSGTAVVVTRGEGAEVPNYRKPADMMRESREEANAGEWYDRGSVERIGAFAGYTPEQVERMSKRQEESARRQFKETAEKLHLGDRITFVDTIDEIEGIDERTREARRRKKGWYDPRTGKIVIILGNHRSMDDVMKSILHEGVAHHGLRQLFGEHFNTFLDNVYRAASPEIRERIYAMAKKHGWDFRTATEEYLATLAEDTEFEKPENQSWWKQVKAWFIDLLHKIGFKLHDAYDTITDNELRYILWRSYENLVHPGRYNSVVEEAKDIAKQYELKVGEWDETWTTEIPEGPNATMEFNGIRVPVWAGNGRRGREDRSDRFDRGDRNDSEDGSMAADGVSEGESVYNGKTNQEKSSIQYEKAKELLQALHDAGYKDFFISRSITDFGVSTYIQGMFGLKFRLSDHGVSSYRRMMEEEHIGLGTTAESVVSTARMYADMAESRNQKYRMQRERERELDEKWERIKPLFAGLGFKRNERTYQNFEKFSSNGKRSNILQIPAGGGAYKYEWTEPVDGNTREKPSYEWLEAFDEEAAEVNTTRYRDGVLFRDGEEDKYAPKAQAAEAYERMVSSAANQWKEAMQDSMLSLKKLYQAVSQAYKGSTKGVYRIEDEKGYENAYLAENRMHSMSEAQIHAYQQDYMKPLQRAIHALTGGKREAYETLTDYMMAKHGLERNEVMAKRDAKKAWEEQHKSEQGNPNYTATKNAVFANIDAGVDDLYLEYRKKDYAGLTALTGVKNVKQAEKEAQRMVDEYEQQHDTTGLWKATNRATRRSLFKMLESGLLSPARHAEIRDMYKYYIPLQGFDSDVAEDVYAYMGSDGTAMYGTTIRAAKGRKSKADDPIATIAMNGEAAIRRGNRNLMKQHFLRFVQAHPSDLVSINDVWLRKNANGEWEQYFDADLKETDTPEEVARKVRDFNERMERDAAANPDMYKRSRELPNVPFRVLNVRDMAQHQVMVQVDGKNYLLTINGNPRAAQALNGLTNPDVFTEGAFGSIMNATQSVVRTLSQFYTTRNPNFVLSNFLRDAVYTNSMVLAKESPNYALNFHKNFLLLPNERMGVLFASWENGKLREKIANGTASNMEKMFYDFMMNGGETGWTSLRDIEKHKRDLQKALQREGNIAASALNKLGDFFDITNRMIENHARFTAYVTSIEMGRSVERAVWDAKEISVNFNKKGAGDKFLKAKNQTFVGKVGAFVSGFGRGNYAFWNASLQGLNNIARIGKRNPAKFMAVMTPLLGLGVAIPLLNALLGGDDDDDKNAYWNLPEYVRRSNICFRFTKDMPWITIPLPIEFRAVYGLGELGSGVALGKEHYSNSDLTKQVAAQFSQVLPLDFMEGGGGWHCLYPTWVKPVIEAYSNKSWTGLPIYRRNTYGQYDVAPEWQRAYSNTNNQIMAATKWLNEATGGDEVQGGYIDLNPARIEYMLRGYLGGYFTVADQVIKMGETATGNREFEWRNMMLANRVVKEGDERTEARKLTNEYFNLKEEYEKTDKSLKAYKKKQDEGTLSVVGQAHYIALMNDSEEYGRYLVFGTYKPLFEAYYNQIKEANAAGDSEEAKRLERGQNELRREMVNIIHDMDNGGTFDRKKVATGINENLKKMQNNKLWDAQDKAIDKSIEANNALNPTDNMEE